MAKLSIRRVFIRDFDGLYFEICGISNPKDHFGEHYVKIVFPKFEYTKLIAQERDDEFKPTSYDEFKTRVQDFTYHYNGGVAHYKTTLPGYMDQIRKLPTLHSSNALDLLTYTIFTLIPMHPVDKTKVNTTDFVLEYPFNEMPRDIQITMSADPDVKITNIGPSKLLNHTTFPLDEPNVYMTLCDYVRRERNDNPILVTQLYRASDPTRFLKKPKMLPKRPR